MDLLIAILKAIGFIGTCLGITALIVFGVSKAPILTIVLFLIVIIIIATIMFYN